MVSYSRQTCGRATCSIGVAVQCAPWSCLQLADNTVRYRGKLCIDVRVFIWTIYSEWMVGDAVEQHGYTMPAYLLQGAMSRVIYACCMVTINQR
jgi:hypothetical protein